jgi:hypothetical protein
MPARCLLRAQTVTERNPAAYSRRIVTPAPQSSALVRFEAAVRHTRPPGSRCRPAKNHISQNGNRVKNGAGFNEQAFARPFACHWIGADRLFRHGRLADIGGRRRRHRQQHAAPCPRERLARSPIQQVIPARRRRHAIPVTPGPRNQPFPTSLAKVSRRPMVRLNTRRSGVESLSRTK